MSGKNSSILVIRRDNIGDLLCTTPLLRVLRRHYPDAHITVLVNSYNAPALQGNPDVDEILVYEKSKHRKLGQSLWHWLGGRLRVMLAIRRGRYALVFLATPVFSASSLKFALMTQGDRIVGYGLPIGYPRFVSIDHAPPGIHEVEAVGRLLQPLDIFTELPAMTLMADLLIQRRLQGWLPHKAGKWIGLHISARKPQQRWPMDRFAALAISLLAQGVDRIVVFWAPGVEDDPAHPGDDGKAASLQARLSGLSVSFLATVQLEELIAGLSLCDQVICADGGAMHIAAALGKPLVCLFGNSDAARWYPWAVPNELLQTPSRDVIDISVDDVMAAYFRLENKLTDKL
jgi:ADP-heptose:LPS heptosyltransferase